MRLAEVGICQAGLYSLLELFDWCDRDDYGGEPVGETVVQQLLQLFFCPGGAGLDTEIIQYQQRCITYLLEEFIVGQFATGVEAGAEVVEEVGSGDVESGAVVGDAMIDNRGRQVGLTTTTGAGQNKPPVRINRKIAGCLKSTGKPLPVDRVVTSPLG